MSHVTEKRVYHLRNVDPDDRIRYVSRYELLDREKPAKPVNTKADFYRRFMRGEFGNHTPMWDSLDDWRSAKYTGLIAIRTVTPGGRCDYNVPPDEVEARTQEFLRQGWNKLHWSAMAPSEHTLVQGEVVRTHFGLTAFVSRHRSPMRESLKRAGVHISGLLAKLQLQHFLCAASWEWLQHLLDSYPGHIVEFSTFPRPCGVIRSMNTIFWEVRNY